MKWRCFLFDLDGTLVSMELDFLKIRKKIKEILIKYGMPEEKIRFGETTLESLYQMKKYMIKNSLNYESALRESIDLIREEEIKASKMCKPMEGSRELFEFLKDNKKRIGIITRNRRESTLISLKRAKLIEFCDLILTREDVLNPKPNPEHLKTALKFLGANPKDCVFVGDHGLDISSGREVGLETVGVLSGSGSRKSLRKADFVFQNLKEFLEFLR